MQRLAARLEREGRPFLLTREPGGTAIGEKIRDLLQFAPEGAAMRPETEVLLFEASRSQLVREVIEPALERGLLVISDRFFDSTTVYQGAARRLDPQVTEQLNAFAVGVCRPDITFVLDVDVATARARMLRRVRPVGAPDRMEQEPVEFYERVCAAYRELAPRETERVQLIDGSRSVDEIETEICQLLHERFRIGFNRKFEQWLFRPQPRFPISGALMNRVGSRTLILSPARPEPGNESWHRVWLIS